MGYTCVQGLLQLLPHQVQQTAAVLPEGGREAGEETSHQEDATGAPGGAGPWPGSPRHRPARHVHCHQAIKGANLIINLVVIHIF